MCKALHPLLLGVEVDVCFLTGTAVADKEANKSSQNLTRHSYLSLPFCRYTCTHTTSHFPPHCKFCLPNSIILSQLFAILANPRELTKCLHTNVWIQYGERTYPRAGVCMCMCAVRVQCAVRVHMKCCRLAKSRHTLVSKSCRICIWHSAGKSQNV